MPPKVHFLSLHIHPNSAVTGYTTDCALLISAHSSKLCCNWLCHWRRTSYFCTFLQTAIIGYTSEGALLVSAHLSSEITPISLATSAPSVNLVKCSSTKSYQDPGRNIVPKYSRKHQVCPPRVIYLIWNSLLIWTVLVLFVLVEALWAVVKETQPDITQVVWLQTYSHLTKGITPKICRLCFCPNK